MSRTQICSGTVEYDIYHTFCNYWVKSNFSCLYHLVWKLGFTLQVHHWDFCQWIGQHTLVGNQQTVRRRTTCLQGLLFWCELLSGKNIDSSWKCCLKCHQQWLSSWRLEWHLPGSYFKVSHVSDWCKVHQGFRLNLSKSARRLFDGSNYFWGGKVIAWNRLYLD